MNSKSESEARSSKSKKLKDVFSNIQKLSVDKYIPENTIVRRVSHLPGSGLIPIIDGQYMLVQVVKPLQREGHRTLIEELRRSQLGPQNYGRLQENQKPVEHGDFGFIFVGKQSHAFLNILTNSSIYAPNNPYENMGRDKNGNFLPRVDINTGKLKFLPETVFTFNSHRALWHVPGFYSGFASQGALVNSAISLIVGQDQNNKGQYKLRTCEEDGKTQVEYYFKFEFPEMISEKFPKEFPLPISDDFLGNLTVVYKKDYKDLLKFLKTLDLSLADATGKNDVQFAHTFNDLVIWPNKAESGVPPKEYLLNDSDPRNRLPTLVQIPTKPFAEKAGQGDNSFRLNAWGPFNSLHYISGTIVLNKDYDLKKVYVQNPPSDLKKALQEYHGDHFHRIEGVCNFMFLLKEYKDKIQKSEFIRNVNGRQEIFNCQFPPEGFISESKENENVCPRLQWGDLYSPITGPHRSHFSGHCSDFRLIRKDLYHLPTRSRSDFDAEKTQVFIQNLRDSGVTVVANDFFKLFEVARTHWGNHEDHIHACFDKRDEGRRGFDFSEHTTLEQTCQDFLKKWDQLKPHPMVFIAMPPPKEIHHEIYKCKLMENELGQIIWSANQSIDAKYIAQNQKKLRSEILKFKSGFEYMTEIYNEAKVETNKGRNIVGYGTAIVGSVPFFMAKASLRLLGKDAVIQLSKNKAGRHYISGTDVLGKKLAKTSIASGIGVSALENILLEELRNKNHHMDPSELKKTEFDKIKSLRVYFQSLKQKPDLDLDEYIEQLVQLRILFEKEYQENVESLPGPLWGSILNVMTLGSKLLEDLELHLEYYKLMLELIEEEIRTLDELNQSLNKC